MMDGVRDSTILNTPDGIYTAHTVDDAAVRIYRGDGNEWWTVKFRYDETDTAGAFAVCEEIDRVLEEEYGKALGVDAIDFNRQIEQPVTVGRGSSRMETDRVDRYEVSDRSAALAAQRYHRADVEILERDLTTVFPDIERNRWIRGSAHRFGAAGLVGGEMFLDVLPQLPAEGQLAAAGLGALFVGEPLINAKTNLPTPSSYISKRALNRVDATYTMENPDLDAALSRRYTPEGETRWGWEDYEEHGTFDGKNLEEAWDVVRFLDFETIEKKEGVTLTAARGSYSDAIQLISHITGRDLELTEAEQPIIQKETLNAEEGDAHG